MCTITLSQEPGLPHIFILATKSNIVSVPPGDIYTFLRFCGRDLLRRMST